MIEIKENSLVEILSRRVSLNPQFSRREDAENVVTLGITKGTARQRKQKSVHELMRRN